MSVFGGNLSLVLERAASLKRKGRRVGTYLHFRPNIEQSTHSSPHKRKGVGIMTEVP